MAGKAKKQNKGFTLIELLVVIAIIAILAAILFPVFANAKAAANKTKCSSNMKQMASAMLMYIQDNGERFPKYMEEPSTAWWLPGCEQWWPAKINRYTKNTFVMLCPSAPKKAVCSYGFNWRYLNDFPNQATPNEARGVQLSQVARPTQTVLICEVGVDNTENKELEYGDYVAYPPSATGTQYAYVNRPAFRHNGACNTSFIDGHVAGMKMGTTFFPQLPWAGNGVTNPGSPKYMNALWDLR